MNSQRDEVVDMFRGVVLVDMILMHFSENFPETVSFALQAVDFAIEGFIFLAGFMLGRHYLPRFRSGALEVSKRLLVRAVKIGLVQYVLVFTVSLPFFAYYHHWNVEEAASFLIESLLFINQVPILHILPTFIPFFLASPLILWLMSKERDVLLAFISLALFAFGRWHSGVGGTPGEVIFPVALWQIYFVAGCLLGKHAGGINRINPRGLLAIATAMFVASAFVKYGGYFDEMRYAKAQFDIYPKKFPLNIYGLVYGSSLLAFVFAWSAALIRPAGPTRMPFSALSLLGRYSLLVFFLHVYAVYFVRLLGNIGAREEVIAVSMVCVVMLLYAATVLFDRSIRSHGPTRVYRLLFG